MKTYFNNLKQLKERFQTKAIIDAVIGSFIFSSLVMIPVIIILVELMVVYMFKVRIFAILLIVAALFYNILFHRLLKKALVMKDKEAGELIGKVFNPPMLAISVLLLAIGLVILFVMIPIWLV